MHAALHRAKWNATDPGGLLIRQTLCRNQDQSFPVLDRKLRECFEHVGEVTPPILLRWCPQPSGVVPVRALKLASGFPMLAVERVTQDRKQPCCHAGARLEPAEIRPGA